MRNLPLRGAKSAGWPIVGAGRRGGHSCGPSFRQPFVAPLQANRIRRAPEIGTFGPDRTGAEAPGPRLPRRCGPSCPFDLQHLPGGRQDLHKTNLRDARAPAVCFRCYPYSAFPSPRKFSSSRFTSSAWVQMMQCGPFSTTDRRAPSISLAVRSPEALMGRIRSASP